MNKDNKSSAYDIGRLCCEALQIPIFATVVGTINYTCKIELDGQQMTMNWENTNKLLGRPGWYGVKTGITDAAGPCLASSFRSVNPKTAQVKNYIIVLLNCKSMDIRWQECEQIIQWQQRQDMK